MAKCRVLKGGWWWIGDERRPGDVLDTSDLQVGRWVLDGLVEPIEEERAAVVAPPERAVVKHPKRR